MRLGEGWRGRARRLTVWILVSLSPGRGGECRGGGVCKTEGVGTSFLGLLCPQIPNQDALGRSASPFSLPYPHENTAELVPCHTFLGSRI